MTNAITDRSGARADEIMKLRKAQEKACSLYEEIEGAADYLQDAIERENINAFGSDAGAGICLGLGNVPGGPSWSQKQARKAVCLRAIEAFVPVFPAVLGKALKNLRASRKTAAEKATHALREAISGEAQEDPVTS